MEKTLRPALLVSISLAVAAVLVGCSSTSSSTSAGASSAVPSQTSSEQAIGELSGLWDVPRDVQVAYYRAICTASGAKLGLGGTFDDAAETCTTPDGMKADVDFGVRSLLSSDAEQMRQSTQFMVTEVGVPVDGCPTVEEYTTVADLTITNDCVIAAMKAVTTYMSN